MIEKTLRLLGHKARDKISGFEGVIDSVGFDLYGCVQATVRPGLDDKGEPREARWFDVQRLEILTTEPVMTAPSFGADVAPAQYDRGPAEKTVQR